MKMKGAKNPMLFIKTEDDDSAENKPEDAKLNQDEDDFDSLNERESPDDDDDQRLVEEGKDNS